MAKTLISRLDAENIVRAAVDPETHEATGDVYDSVNDVSYPFGGGGGKALPVCTVNIDSNFDVSLFPYNVDYFGYVLNDAGNTISIIAEIPSGESSFDFIYEDLDGEPTALSGLNTEGMVITPSDAINCTVTDLEGVTVVIVTDPTLDSSITLTIDGK